MTMKNAIILLLLLAVFLTVPAKAQDTVDFTLDLGARFPGLAADG